MRLCSPVTLVAVTSWGWRAPGRPAAWRWGRLNGTYDPPSDPHFKTNQTLVKQFNVSKLFLFFCQALFVVLLLGWLFVPVYLTAGVSPSLQCSSSGSTSMCDGFNVLPSGDHHAPVPEEALWRNQDQHLPLRHLPLPLRFHKDFSEFSHLKAGSSDVLLSRVCFCRWTCFLELCLSSRRWG